MPSERDNAPRKQCKVLERGWLVCLVVLGFVALIWRFLWFNWSPIVVFVISIAAGLGFLGCLLSWRRVRQQINRDTEGKSA